MKTTTKTTKPAHLATGTKPTVAQAKKLCKAPTKDANGKTVKPTLIVKPGKGKAIAISPYQTALFDALRSAQQEINKVALSHSARIEALITKQYGKVSPTYAQFKADRAALHTLAVNKGLASDQVLRKAYNGVINSLYGKLPESDSAAAIAKRAQRPTVDKSKKAKAAKKGAGTASKNETVAQFIARVGLAVVLQEVAKQLAVERASRTDAIALEAIASHYQPKKAA